MHKAVNDFFDSRPYALLRLDFWILSDVPDGDRSDNRGDSLRAETLLNIIGRRNLPTASTKRTWQAVAKKLH